MLCSNYEKIISDPQDKNWSKTKPRSIKEYQQNKLKLKNQVNEVENDMTKLFLIKWPLE